MLRPLLTALVTAAALALPTVPADAGPPADSSFRGGCGTDTVQDQGGRVAPGAYTGVIYGYAVARARTFEHNPVTVTSLRCSLYVNGARVLEAAGTAAGPAAVLAPAPVQFLATPEDSVWLCFSIEMVDAHGGRTSYECAFGINPFPPQEVDDAVDLVWTAVPWGAVDAAACPVLAQLAPHAPADPLRVDPTGDVFVAGELVWDCPPYGTG